jgi:hypothetical protein
MPGRTRSYYLLTRESLGMLDLFGPPKQSIPTDTAISSVEALSNEAQATKVSGISFSEIMYGHIHVGTNFSGCRKEDFELAARTARGLCEGARFFLSVKAFNTETCEYSIASLEFQLPMAI